MLPRDQCESEAIAIRDLVYLISTFVVIMHDTVSSSDSPDSQSSIPVSSTPTSDSVPSSSTSLNLGHAHLSTSHSSSTGHQCLIWACKTCRKRTVRVDRRIAATLRERKRLRKVRKTAKNKQKFEFPNKLQVAIKRLKLFKYEMFIICATLLIGVSPCF